MTITVTVDGADRLARTAAAAADQLDNLSTVHLSTARMILGTVRAPYDTGRLAGSLSASSTPTEAVISSGLVYAPVQEYGWPAHNIRARRYLGDAFTAAESRAIDQYQRTVDAALADVKGT